MPSSIRCEALGCRTDLGRHAELELVVGHLEEGEEFAGQDTDVRLVDEGVGEFEGTAADGDVTVAQTVEDDGAVSLDSVGVDRDNLVKGVEGDVSENGRTP